MKGTIKFEFSFDEDEEEEVPDPDGIAETLHAMLVAEVAKAGLAPTLTIGEFLLDGIPRDRPHVTKMSDKEVEFSDGGCIEAPDDDGTIRRRDAHGNCEEIQRIGDEGWAHWAGMFGKTEKDFEEEDEE